MFRLAEEFTFSISTNGNNVDFVGQLIFRSKQYNEFGTLYRPENIEEFTKLLNASVPIPDVWTLEIVAECIFNAVKKVLPNLYAINLYIKGMEQRVAEYSLETGSMDVLDNDILELDGIN